jgi:hypothetical protein
MLVIFYKNSSNSPFLILVILKDYILRTQCGFLLKLEITGRVLGQIFGMPTNLFNSDKMLYLDTVT